MDNEELIKKQKERLKEFLLKNNWITYFILILIIILALWIRTLNVDGLVDITTSSPTLGPDLDPFLFLRWSEYIVENGKLFDKDPMRYIPFGYDTSGEYLLHPYMMAWFHNIFSGTFSWTVTQSAIYYPVFMFGITILAFFLFVRKTFIRFTGKRKAEAIALAASLFFSIMPIFLPRTIAGIPEKESAAFFFLFMAFYFFIMSWNASNNAKRIAFGIIAGLSTAGMAFIWGGFLFIFYVLGPSLLIAFLIGAMTKERITSSAAWFISSLVLMLLFFNRFNLNNLLFSSTTGSVILVLLTAVFHNYIFVPYIKSKIQSNKIIQKIPSRVISLILVVFIGLFAGSIFRGPASILGQFSNIYFNFIKPAQSRLINTVAENRQPYFNEWASSFGPQIGGLHLGPTLIIIASVILFYQFCLKITDKKKSIFMSAAYLLMVITTIFSRYTSAGTLNGENMISIVLYALGFLVFIYVSGRFALMSRKNKDGPSFSSASVEIILILIFLIVSLIAARGLIRLVMVLAAPGAIMISFIGVESAAYLLRKKDTKDAAKTIMSIILIIAVLFSAYSYYQTSKATADQYVPSYYTFQWQKAMAWVRDNAPQDAVFGHWWDYGYWLQSIGKRSTVLDGGNAISYWNHLMGRHALTSPNERAALEFLYAHNTTHFLIDSTDIGKYTAFSSIGSDRDYDRRSWIPTFLRDNSQTTERKNSTVFVYQMGGATGLDQDIKYTINGTEIFLPQGKAYLTAIVVSVNKNDSVSEVFGVYYLQEKIYQIPLKYYWDKKTGFVERKEGIDAGIMLYPRIVLNSQGGGEVEPRGAVLYLSPRTVRSQLAKLYLFGEESSSFVLAHSEPDLIVENLKAQNIDAGDFVFMNEFRGPIKIWSINYPKNITLKSEYLETNYPEELVRA